MSHHTTQLMYPALTSKVKEEEGLRTAHERSGRAAKPVALTSKAHEAFSLAVSEASPCRTLS